VTRINLIVDSSIGGVFVPLMHFTLLPSVLIIAVTTAAAASCPATMASETDPDYVERYQSIYERLQPSQPPECPTMGSPR